MNDYLAESRGTLARTAQKKQTAISQYHRQQQLRKKEEKYGFAVRPSNPNLVDRPDAIKFYFQEVYSETSNKLNQLVELNAEAIDREGEGPIRRMNKEVHELILDRARWGRRFMEVGGHVPEKELNPPKKMGYFGAAKYLPEAIKAAANAGDAEQEEGDEDSYVMSGGDEEVEGDATIVPQPTTTSQSVAADLFDDEVAPTKTTRWLSLSPQEEPAPTTPVIQGFTGLEFAGSEERRLRTLEAVALQKARKLVVTVASSSAFMNSNKYHHRSQGASSASIKAETAEGNDEEDDADYNPEMAKHTAAHYRQMVDQNVNENDVDEMRGGDHLNDAAMTLLGMQVLQYNHHQPAEEGGSVPTTTTTTTSNTTTITTNLPTEKEVQARVFAAKKAMMLQQLNRKKATGVSN